MAAIGIILAVPVWKNWKTWSTLNILCTLAIIVLILHVLEEWVFPAAFTIPITLRMDRIFSAAIR